MNILLQTRLDEVRRLCEKYRVESLHLFGSAATGEFDPETSDLDFLVQFQDMPHKEHADAYFGFLEDLERLFDRPVDLLEPEPVRNPYLWSTIERSRQVLYEAA